MARSISSPRFLQIGDVTNALDADSTDVVTLAGWVKLNSAINASVIGKWGNTVAKIQYGLGVDSAGKPFIQWSDGATLNGVTSPSGAGTGVWLHAAGHNNHGANGAEIYLNGVRTNVGTRTVNMQDTTQPLNIGVRGDGSEWANADMAEVAVWDVPLLDAEIAALAKGVSPNRIQRDHLIGYWPLWGVNSPEPDLSGSGSPANLGGGTPATVAHAPVGPYVLL